MRLQFLGLLLYVIFLYSSCEDNSRSTVAVDFMETAAETPELEDEKSHPVYIAIASITSPRETFIYYNQLADYISEKLGQRVLIKQKRTHKEVNDLLRKGAVDFAFICSGAYVDLAENNDVNLLVTPVINGKTVYQAYIIAQKSAVYVTFADLKDKRFAFTDPLSNTGYIYPRFLLKKQHTHERIFFSKTMYTYGHDISIQMVNRGVLDGASVHGLVYEHIKELHPERMENTKILKESEWFAMPPVVSSIQLKKDRQLSYQKLFLNIHKDSLGKAILDKLKIDKFVIAEDSIYDNIRKLRDYVEDKKH